MDNTITVAISSDFLTAFSKLPRQIQGKVTEFINKFRINPKSSGINLEKLPSINKNIRSVRIDDTYRGIVFFQEESSVYLLLWIDHHDEAYEWAKRKTCRVNSKTGALQVFDVQTVEVTEETKPSNVSTLFGGLTKEIMIELGSSQDLIPFLKSIPNKEVFNESKDRLPSDVYENFSWIAEGFDPKEVIDMIKTDTSDTEQEKSEKDGNLPVTEDFSVALKNSESKKSFVVIEGEEELRRIMSEPLEKWRVFLHPTQRKIVKKNYKGAARVLGGAGTGKTVVAMHRAKYLASQISDGEKILFTTFTVNLAEDIKSNLRKICSLEELQKIEVINIDAWVMRFLSEVGFSAKIEYGDEIDKLWQRAVVNSLSEPDYPWSFYKGEWNRVVIPQEALSLEKYIKAKRTGRGVRLDRKKRIEVWKVFDAYLSLMKEEQIRDINMAMYECSKLFTSSRTKNKYAHIIVDEGQDFSDNAFRLLRTVAGEERPNDIFIVGDSHQRIYNNYPTLSKCGINVRGRSSILKINYRTTEETRRYAFSLLNGISFDDLDDDVDLGDKCLSLVHGEAPVVKCFADANEELSYLNDCISDLQDRCVPLKNICIVARTNQLVKDYSALLTKSGHSVYQIKRSKAEDLSHDGIRIATMNRVKGLEFQYVFIVSANNRIVPLEAAIDHSDPITERESYTAEKCLLYVALTRAQKQAYITCYGKNQSSLIHNKVAWHQRVNITKDLSS